MKYEIIVVGSFEVNCVVLWQDSRAVWVIDPGADPEVILDFLSKHEMGVALYFLTHGHIDHVSALDGLLVRQPAPVYLHAADAAWAFSSHPATSDLPPDGFSSPSTIPYAKTAAIPVSTVIVLMEAPFR